MSLPFSIVGSGDDAFITLFIPGDEQPLVAHSSHPNYVSIVAELDDPDPHGDYDYLRELFDVAESVREQLESLSERVKVENGQITLDGVVVDNTLTEQVLRFLDAGVADWKPLVRFFERVQDNPSTHSREMFYSFVKALDLTITPAGKIIAYKGVTKTEDGEYLSGFTGAASVNGVRQDGRIKQSDGDVVTMPREQVAFDPATPCSTGLHVGTFDYAHGYAKGALLKVIVDPADVVSVPNDANGQKVRVSRYTILEAVDAPETALVDDGGYYTADDDYDSDDYDSDDYDSDGYDLRA